MATQTVEMISVIFVCAIGLLRHWTGDTVNEWCTITFYYLCTEVAAGLPNLIFLLIPVIATTIFQYDSLLRSVATAPHYDPIVNDFQIYCSSSKYFFVILALNICFVFNSLFLISIVPVSRTLKIIFKLYASL